MTCEVLIAIMQVLPEPESGRHQQDQAPEGHAGREDIAAAIQVLADGKRVRCDDRKAVSANHTTVDENRD